MTEEFPEADVPRVLRLMWGHEAAARPGPKPTLTIGDIAAAAVAIADAEGLAAVSMSRVAAALGFTTMSLYRYVDSKSDVHLAMFDHAYGSPEPPRRPTAGWRRLLSDWAFANRAVLLAHPWLHAVPITAPPLGPHQVAWMELGLRALARTKLPEQEKLSSMLLVDVYVRGQTQLANEIAEQQPGDSSAPDPHLYSRRLAALVDAERFPAVWAAVASGALADDTDFASDEFRFGLDTVLDGIDALVERRSSTSRGRR